MSSMLAPVEFELEQTSYSTVAGEPIWNSSGGGFGRRYTPNGVDFYPPVPTLWHSVVIEGDVPANPHPCLLVLWLEGELYVDGPASVGMSSTEFDPAGTKLTATFDPTPAGWGTSYQQDYPDRTGPRPPWLTSLSWSKVVDGDQAFGTLPNRAVFRWRHAERALFFSHVSWFSSIASLTFVEPGGPGLIGINRSGETVIPGGFGIVQFYPYELDEDPMFFQPDEIPTHIKLDVKIGSTGLFSEPVQSLGPFPLYDPESVKWRWTDRRAFLWPLLPDAPLPIGLLNLYPAAPGTRRRGRVIGSSHRGVILP